MTSTLHLEHHCDDLGVFKNEKVHIEELWKIIYVFCIYAYMYANYNNFKTCNEISDFGV